MNEEQAQAFKVASGNLTPEWINLVATGLLFAVLILWCASSMISVYRGWSKGHVDTDRATSALVRMVLLVVVALFFFAN